MSKILEQRDLDNLTKSLLNTEGIPTKTSNEQNEVEQIIYKIYKNRIPYIKCPLLYLDAHRKLLVKLLYRLPPYYEALDASRPWVCYWILHPLSLMHFTIDLETKSKIAVFLAKCQSPSGGFGGGPGQYAHLAATYAAVNAIVILANEEAFNIINRKTLLAFLNKMHQPDGSFSMHEDGEIDVRGAYCAISVASLVGLLPNLNIENTAQWISSCQTYEGGFAGCPGMEAHGGLSFCAISALVILNKGHLCDKSALLRWLVHRQMKMEGGFQGRTNKLVDGCYSFWQGAAFPILYTMLAKDGDDVHDHLFDQRALQEYILINCQHLTGGLVDKPGKQSDVYHTCYDISGLSVAQHFKNQVHLLGPKCNELVATHPLYNIRFDYVKKALLYFTSLNNQPT